MWLKENNMATEITQKYVNEISHAIIGYAIEVHKELGPGLLESIYEKCLTHLLIINGYKVLTQQIIPLNFRGLELDCGLRFDMLVNDLVIVELKTVESFVPINETQLFTYLKLLKMPKGILINFNCVNIFKEGQKTFVTDHFRRLPIE